MPYASKYYDPKKAHDYYMRTRELKGYENRYGGARGDGTSAASGMVVNNNSTSNNSSRVTRTASSTYGSLGSSNSSSTAMTFGPPGTGANNSSNGLKIGPANPKNKVAGQVVESMYKGSHSGAAVHYTYTVRESTGDDELDELIEKYDKVKAGFDALKKEHKKGNDAFKKDWKSLSKEDKQSFREAINYNNEVHKQDTAGAKKEMEELKAAIKKRREAIKREKQEKKQRDAEAKLYIQDQMNQERDETIKKVNKSIDNDMLSETRRFADNLQKRRQNGERIDNKVLLAQIKALSGRAKKSKIKYKKKYISEYKTKYKEELDRYYKNG